MAEESLISWQLVPDRRALEKVRAPGSRATQKAEKGCLMARTPSSLLRDILLPKLQQLYRAKPIQYQQVDDAENNNHYTNNNYSNVNNNLLELPTPGSPGLRLWQRWTRNIVGLNCLFVPTPRRYLALPRTPVQTDSLDIHQAASIYRHSRAADQDWVHSTEFGARTSRGGCITSSTSYYGSTYRPFEQLVLQAWRYSNWFCLVPYLKLLNPFLVKPCPWPQWGWCLVLYARLVV